MGLNDLIQHVKAGRAEAYRVLQACKAREPGVGDTWMSGAGSQSRRSVLVGCRIWASSLRRRKAPECVPPAL